MLQILIAVTVCRAPQGAVDTILSYCHNNLADQTLLDLLPYLHEKGVGVISASFSSMGLLRKEVREVFIWNPSLPLLFVISLWTFEFTCCSGFQVDMVSLQNPMLEMLFRLSDIDYDVVIMNLYL